MSEDELDLKLNFIFLGDSTVGKSSIIRQYAEGQFLDTTTATIGVDFKCKTIKYKDKTDVLIKIWDTAGQEKFGTIAKSFYRNSNGVFVVCDVTVKESFEKINSWINCLVEQSSTANQQTVLLANKIDLDDKREVTGDDLASYSKQAGIKYFEVSAKTGEGIQTAFDFMIESVLKSMNVVDAEGNLIATQENDGFEIKKEKIKTKRKCC